MENEYSVEINQTYELKIEDLTEDGQGIAKEQGLVVFVSGGTLGDTVKVKITKVKKNLAFGKAIQIVSLSPLRKKQGDICPIIQRCGGCPYGLLQYEEQLKLKERQVKDKLSRIGKVVNPNVKPIIGADNLDHYRNKVVLHVEPQKNISQDDPRQMDTKSLVGFYRPRSHEIVNVKGCKIAPEDIDEVIDFAEANVKVKCDLTIKEAKGTGEEMIVSVMKNSKPDVIAGPRTITDEMNIAGHQMKFEISPEAFYQVNPEQTVKLYEKVLECLNLQGDEKILDLYCGVGTIGLVCAKEMEAKCDNSKQGGQEAGTSRSQVLGIEMNKSAILDANRNAVINYIVNAQYIHGKAEDKLEDIVEFGADVAIVDPPRAGCDENLLRTISDAGIPKLCYVSCNPATLARDVKYMEVKGYKLIEATPVDMFPETGHVETVALITRVK